MENIAELVVQKLDSIGWRIATMESCTGGNIISTLTNVSGASNVTDGGFCTYSNKQKIRMGVPETTINQHGVYSKETAIDMANAACKLNECEIGVGVTGTFSNLDKNNKDSIALKAYYAIIIYDRGLYCYEEDIPDTDRMKQKEYLTNIILSKLNELLGSSV